MKRNILGCCLGMVSVAALLMTGSVTAQPAGDTLVRGDVKAYPGKPLYDPDTLRTLFLQFESGDWEQKLEAARNADAEVAAAVTMDGRTYRKVGVSFRGNTSYRRVPTGYKRSLNLSVDMAVKDQRILGYRTLELMNSAADQSFLRIALYNHIARDYLPAPKANFMRVMINGEDWGIYVNRQQFNSDFVKEAVGVKGWRWKVRMQRGGQSGLGYLGEDPNFYRNNYEIKSEDTPESWAALIRLCRVLNRTPPDQLEQAIQPLLDVDGALRFLALENVFISNDGYWARASDYSLYTDGMGRFHLAPYDVNETFRPLERFGRSFSGSNFANGVQLDPLVSADDPGKPLLYRLLAVPTLKQRYLAYVREIAEKWLDWNQLGPLAQRYHTLIAPYVALDTHKLVSTEEFLGSLTRDGGNEDFGPTSPSPLSLKSFADQRRTYLRRYFRERARPAAAR
jgi:spore coat protein CotH